MPRLWKQTIDAHREAVRDTTLAAAESLVAEKGLRGVTMSAIAARTGIGRATLYKYFPDVEAILRGWHHRRIADHLSQLREVASAAPDPGAALHAVLLSYARIAAQRGHHGDAIASTLHADPNVGQAESTLIELLTELIAAAALAGAVRTDVPAAELAAYAVAALGAPTRDKDALTRRAAVVEAGLRPVGPA